MSDNDTLKFKPREHVETEAEPAEEPVYEVDDSYDAGEPQTALAPVEKPVEKKKAPKATPRAKATPRTTETRSARSGDGVRTPRSAEETADLSEAKRILDRKARKTVRKNVSEAATEAASPEEPAASKPRFRMKPKAKDAAEDVSGKSGQDGDTVEERPAKKAFTPKKAVDLGAAAAWVKNRVPKKDPNAPKVPLREKRWPRVALLVLGVFAVVALFLYAPLKDLYTVERNQSRLNAQLELLNSNNEELADRISELQTKEGIMDEARRHGYVVEGETAVEVEGVDDGEADGTAAVAPDALGTQLPDEDRPWYIVALDAIFGYEASQ